MEAFKVRLEWGKRGRQRVKGEKKAEKGELNRGKEGGGGLRECCRLTRSRVDAD